MNNDIKLVKTINKKILMNIKEINYMQNLRNGIEVYDEKCIGIFFDSLREYILLNDTDINFNKFVVFWIDFIIQNYGKKVNKKIREKLNDIITTLDIYPLLYDKNFREDNKVFFNIFDEITIRIREKNNKILNDTQYYVRNKILQKKNIVFSAPTSFGKSSLVIDSINELFLRNEIKKVLFILPTKALINEYRRKIIKTVSDVNIIENPHVTMKYNKVIYLFTPERFLVFYENNKDIEIDYVVNDEAQTLININKKKCVNRTILLAKVLSVISNKKIPIIFLMPYIVNPYDSFIFKYVNFENDEVIQVSNNILTFVSNNYYMLDVDENGDLFRYDFSKDAGIENANKKFIGTIDKKFNKNDIFEWGNIVVDNLEKIIDIDKKFIIYSTNKGEIKAIANKIISNNKLKITQISYRMQALINYIEKNIGSEFEYIDFLKNGIAVHFSEIDTYIKRQVEIIFNEEDDLKGIVCTSTLLQGVNLNAQNLIMIYGKKFSTIGNVDIDYRNLIGRSARLGINIQGNIFNVSCCKDIKNSGIKLYKSSEPVKINFERIIDKVKKEEKNNEIIKTYSLDSKVKTRLKNDLKDDLEIEIENIDYFIGYKKKKNVEEKLMKEDIDNYVDLLKNIGNYEKTLELINKLSILYEWKDSEEFDVSHRMRNVEYITRLAINTFKGNSVQKIIEDNINYVEKNDNYKLVVCKNIYKNEYVTMIKKENYNSENMKIFNRKEDINTYIYTILYDIQHIIEFQLKKYIQDIYYRIKKINNISIEEVEEILDYSTIDKKKIALNNIGIVDLFAINILIKEDYKDFFDSEGNVNIELLKDFANEIPEDDPLRYAILDVL